MGLFINTQDSLLSEDVCCLGVSPYLLDILSECIDDLQVLNSIFVEAEVLFSSTAILNEEDKSFGQKFKDVLVKARDKILEAFKKLLDMLINAFRSFIAFFRNLFKKKETELSKEEKRAFEQAGEDLDRKAREKFKKEGFVVFFYQAHEPLEILVLSGYYLGIIKTFMEDYKKDNSNLDVDKLEADIKPAIDKLNSIRPNLEGNGGGVRTNITLDKFDKGMNDCIRDIIEIRQDLQKVGKMVKASPASKEEYSKLCKVARIMQSGHEALSRTFQLFMHVERESISGQKQKNTENEAS